jgi:PD-(D/E)XK nuclease superfamily
MKDWARWITDGVECYTDVLTICVEGHISTFEERWPIFMQRHLNTTVAKVQGAVSLENIYQVYFLGHMHSLLRPMGWEVSIEPRDRDGYINIRFISRTQGRAVLIELKKSSEKPEHMESDASEALERIVDKNYRNQESLLSVRVLREYGVASYQLASCVKGRYLERDTQSRWVEKDDPAMRIER